MTGLVFEKATKAQTKLRIALTGPSGQGKTFTALRLACAIAEREGGRVAFADTERGSAKHYAHLFDFDHLAMPDAHPHTCLDAVKAAYGHSVLVFDSLSHEWEALNMWKDREAAAKFKGDTFRAWSAVNPAHNAFVDALLRFPGHTICTLRVKTEYTLGEGPNGKTKITKLGLKPVQRDSVDSEFDVVGDMHGATLTVSKTRVDVLPLDSVIEQPGEDLAGLLWDWCQDGEAAPPMADPADVADVLSDIESLTAEGRRWLRARMVEAGVHLPLVETPEADWPAAKASVLALIARWVEDHTAAPAEEDPA